MRYRNLSHRVRSTKDGRYLVEISGDRKRWGGRWRAFTEPILFRARRWQFWKRPEVASFHSRLIAERAAALQLERSESYDVDERVRKYARASGD